MASEDTFEGLDVTADEVQRIEKALKNEEFRKLFVEYAQEISDPENRKKYEEELAELERSRGMDVKFLHPKPGYVLKTSINGEKKAFINICKNDNIGKPQASKSYQGSGNARKMGVEWALPYSLAPGRDDYDHAGKKCMVFDCLFHPDCFEMINKDSRFRTLMDNTAMDGIEREFKVTFDRNNVKKPKMKFKGRQQATVLRTPNQSGPKGENSLDALKLSYPYDKSMKQETANNQPAKTASKISGNRDSERKTNDEKRVEKDDFTVPKHSIVHRGHFDMQQFTYARDSAPSTRPQELILKVELPLLKSAATVQLDVFEKRIFLECKKPVMYQLDLPLPYPVDEDKGSAKFDKSRTCLIITLAVLPPVIAEIPSSVPVPQEANPLVQEIVMNGIDETVNQRTKQADGISPGFNDDQYEKPENVKDSNETNPGKSDVGTSDYKITPSIGADVTDALREVQGSQEGDVTKVVEDSEPSHPLSDEIHADDLLHSELEVKTTLPKCDIYQTDENVTIIIREADIDVGSFKLNMASEGKIVEAMFRRTEIAPDSAEEIFSILVVCEDGQTLDGKMKPDVSQANVVMVFKKKEGCGSLWSALKAGLSEDTLEEKQFVTEEGLEDILKEVTSDEARSKETIPCSVSEFSTHCVKAQFQVSCEVADSSKSSQDSGKHKGDSDGCQKASMKSKESIIPALDLGPAADEKKVESDVSSPRSDPQSSPTDSSIPSGLKSALRSPRRRACKSVSFSEEVLVELFLDGPKRTQKGGNKKKGGGRRTPFFGPRRMIEKLKDNSWEYFSDSELLHHKEASTEEDEEHEDQEWNWQPNQVLMRQSSSESESGQEIPSSPRSKGKKSKGSRRRRKEKARREASLAANNGVESSDTNENLIKPSSPDDVSPLTNGLESEEIIESNELNGDTPELPENRDLMNNNENKKSNENDELPLEMQDHKTKCAFEFSNQVIYDLDE
nr:protein kintoun-like [Lytechinus pictus]